MKETLYEGNVELCLWKSGLVNITTNVYLSKERATLEILEQVHEYCPLGCPERNKCFGHCDNAEIISYVTRNIWVNDV